MHADVPGAPVLEPLALAAAVVPDGPGGRRPPAPAPAGGVRGVVARALEHAVLRGGEVVPGSAALLDVEQAEVVAVQGGRGLAVVACALAGGGEQRGEDLGLRGPHAQHQTGALGIRGGSHSPAADLNTGSSDNHGHGLRRIPRRLQHLHALHPEACLHAPPQVAWLPRVPGSAAAQHLRGPVGGVVTVKGIRQQGLRVLRPGEGTGGPVAQGVGVARRPGGGRGDRDWGGARQVGEQAHLLDSPPKRGRGVGEELEVKAHAIPHRRRQQRPVHGGLHPAPVHAPAAGLGRHPPRRGVARAHVLPHSPGVRAGRVGVAVVVGALVDVLGDQEIAPGLLGFQGPPPVAAGAVSGEGAEVHGVRGGAGRGAEEVEAGVGRGGGGEEDGEAQGAVAGSCQTREPRSSVPSKPLDANHIPDPRAKPGLLRVRPIQLLPQGGPAVGQGVHQTDHRPRRRRPGAEEQHPGGPRRVTEHGLGGDRGVAGSNRKPGHGPGVAGDDVGHEGGGGQGSAALRNIQPSHTHATPRVRLGLQLHPDHRLAHHARRHRRASLQGLAPVVERPPGDGRRVAREKLRPAPD
mmetsp:Transcript_53701/g.123051  ORF Transcript_53701/g.123051 Transcript_53701/m.123051 type:complete len:576 (+) Transcript_53701:6272-7999(+)